MSLDLFGSSTTRNDKSESGQDTPVDKHLPLAERMRPRHLDEIVGHTQLLGSNAPLRRLIESDRIGSMIFWGPPGSGKTTVARLIAGYTKGEFIPFSAVTAGIKEVKEVLAQAALYFRQQHRRTYLFIDEIHRFNRAQQDAFLPYVERGEITLLGATTENPSFEVNAALLSRVRVFVLQRLQDEDLAQLLMRTIADTDRGLGENRYTISPDGIVFLLQRADGDARRLLTHLEAIAAGIPDGTTITAEICSQSAAANSFMYDKTGEEHYNLISALHKTIRGGDPDGALYWLARMLGSGEDPMYVVRRLIRFASEDIGLADPQALALSLAARDSYHMLGSPEGELAIAQLVVYLATAPKSNSVYTAWKQATLDAQAHGSLPVPLHIRNAPTPLMKALDYGKEYQYAHQFLDGLTDQSYFPDALGERRYLDPKETGDETRIANYLTWYRTEREKLLGGSKKPSQKK